MQKKLLKTQHKMNIELANKINGITLLAMGVWVCFLTIYSFIWI